MFDSTLIENSTFEDVDVEAIELYKNSLKKESVKELFKQRTNEEILECIGAGKIDSKGVFHLNNAGALFFAKDLKKFDLDYEVKMVRFNGTNRINIIDHLTVNNTILKLIKEFEKFFDKNTKTGLIVKGFKNYNIPEYPIEAVREAFINAIAHRDYSLDGDCITFYIYDDRILISSPGSLPYPLTVDDLKIEVNPKHRNKTICKILKNTKYMGDYGTGITRMREEMKKSGLSEPEFFNTNYFKVILKGPDGELIVTDYHLQKENIDLSELNLNKRQLKAIKMMFDDNIKFRHKTYSEEFNVSITTSKRDLQYMVEKGLINKYENNHVKIYSLNSLSDIDFKSIPDNL